LERVHKDFDVFHGKHGIRFLGVPAGGASEGPDAGIVFGETSDDLGWIVEEIGKHDDLDLVAGRHVVGERTSAEHCDVRYGRVFGGGAKDLKASCVWIQNWIGLEKQGLRRRTDTCGSSQQQFHRGQVRGGFAGIPTFIVSG
jgi:hypothetical protein